MNSPQSINFFKKNKISINKLFPSYKFKKNLLINDVKPLYLAKKNDLTFYDSKKYEDNARSSKALFCITTEKLSKDLPNVIEKIIVKNVLFELAIVLKKIYPTADIDYPDNSLKKMSMK